MNLYQIVGNPIKMLKELPHLGLAAMFPIAAMFPLSNRDGMHEMQQLETWLQVSGVGVPPRDWNARRGSAN
ncbi:hypothetical protein C1H46_043929 [Malus baccata]|uniref:Uncharacterized protein n=1 Tax=Malus baccata TaxID=106549 RepID=A0A540K8J0_MALBA|nr:hypothetical protein C1H46_043929 [Malus baccata]